MYVLQEITTYFWENRIEVISNMIYYISSMYKNINFKNVVSETFSIGHH